MTEQNDTKKTLSDAATTEPAVKKTAVRAPKKTAADAATTEPAVKKTAVRAPKKTVADAATAEPAVKKAAVRAPKKTVADAAKIALSVKSAKREAAAKPETSEEIRDAIVRILEDKKATHIVSVKVDHLTVVADYFVIASASNTTAVRSLGENVDDRMSKLGMPPVRMEGIREGKWAALDFGSIIVHIFHNETRAIYQLEKLWTDGTNVVEY